MINFLEINEINNEYIHMMYKNKKQEALKNNITNEELIYLFNQIKAMKDFYKQMIQECGEVYDMEYTQLEKMYCPTPDEIQKADLFTKIKLESQQEKYKDYANRVFGKAELASYASEKYDKYYRLSCQFASVLGARMIQVGKIIY